MECAERLALSLSLSPLSPSHYLATSSRHHPVLSRRHSLTSSMPAACIQFSMPPKNNSMLQHSVFAFSIFYNASLTITLDDYVLGKPYPVSFKLPEASEQTDMLEYRICLHQKYIFHTHDSPPADPLELLTNCLTCEERVSFHNIALSTLNKNKRKLISIYCRNNSLMNLQS